MRRRFVCAECLGEIAPEEAEGLTFFFSYGHDQNEPIVQRLKEDLESRGHRVWIDTARIQVGQDWRGEITQGLLDADTVVSFLSRHSVRVPGVCLDELRIALSVKSGRIQTVLLESETEVDPPPSLSDVQWLEMSDWDRRRAADPDAFEDWYRDRLSELCGALESREVRELAGEITQLQRLLRPQLADTKERRLLCSPFVGRRWLTEELERWRSAPAAPPAFVLFGGPGVGKSRFAVEQLHTNPHVLCGVLCEWSGGGAGTAASTIRTLAFRLAARLPDYRRLLLSTLSGAGIDLTALGADALFEALITYPLSQLIDGGRGRRLIVIDGLDELDVDDANPLAVLLARHLSRLPPWIGVVLTSRAEGPARAAFSDWQPHVIAADDLSHVQDIRQYLALELKARLQAEPGTLQVLDRLVAAAEGSFLYATLLCESAARPEFSLAEVAGLVPGLDAFYLRSLQRMFPDYDDFLRARGLLEVLVVINPAPVFLLRAAADDDPYAVADLSRRLGSFLVTAPRAFPDLDEPLEAAAFCHKSIADWLTDPTRSGRFFVDAGNGRMRVGRTLLSKLAVLGEGDRDGGPEAQELDPEATFVSARVAPSLLEAGMWSELESLLTRPARPLWPTWTVIGDIPQHRLAGPLLDHLWQHPDRDGFLRRLQRHGNRTVTVDVVALAMDSYGRGSLDLPVLDVYIDALHLNGSYRDAVAQCDRVLVGLPPQAIMSDATLLRLAIRRLHHLMFFSPVDPLLAEAKEWRASCDPKAFPDLFNELLFLIGGNLGVLSGDVSAARPVIEESLSFARSRGSIDDETRALRKVVDLMCWEGDAEEAYGLASSLVAPDASLTSRYHMYLLGSLGEACRHTGRYTESSACFEALGRHAAARGAPGWHAHAFLGLAALSSEVGQDEDAWEYVGAADAIYSGIGQSWGRVAAAMVGARLGPTGRGRERSTLTVEESLALAGSLNYRREEQALRRLVDDEPEPLHLLFL